MICVSRCRSNSAAQSSKPPSCWALECWRQPVTAPDVLAAITEITATSATHSCGLADGSDGQVKTIIDTSASGTNAITITPSNLRGYSTITLNAPGESVTLLFKNSNWNVIAGNGYALA